MPDVRKHLVRVHARCIDLIADEVRNGETLLALYPKIGSIHPAEEREGHVQHIVFAGLRGAGYFTIAESNYFVPLDPNRRIDTAVWLPDVERWLFLEVEPCSPQGGYSLVLKDARKLVTDKPSDPRDQLRGLLVFGFRDSAGRDRFPQKCQDMSAALQALGFSEIAIEQRDLSGTRYTYTLVGLWAMGL